MQPPAFAATLTRNPADLSGPWAGAADLKFLHRCREFDQQLQIEKRHQKPIFASAPLFPKCVSGAAMVHELRKTGRWPVLSGIGSVCTSVVAAFCRVNPRKH